MNDTESTTTRILIAASFKTATITTHDRQKFMSKQSEPAEQTVTGKRSTKHAITNLFSLTAIQASNAFSPLLIYPFVLAMVGDHHYTEIVLAETFTMFLLTFVIYSFEIDGVASIVGFHPERNRQEISTAVSEIITLRLLFYFVGIVFLEAIVALIKPSLSWLVFGWSLVSLSYALQPNWLYQGLERNLPIAITTIVSRLGALVTILAVIRGESDYALVPYIIGLWYLGGAIAALAYAVHAFKLQWVTPSAKRAVWLAKHGTSVFVGNLGTVLYRDTGILFLSALGISSSGIAAYSLAEKLAKAVQAATRPLNQYFFPRALAVAKAAGSPSKSVFKQILRFTFPQEVVVLCLIISLALVYLVGKDQITAFVHIQNLEYALQLAILMSTVSFFGTANFMFGSAGLNALGARKNLLKAIVLTGLISAAVNVASIPLMGELGAAVCFVLSELLLLTLIIRRYWI
jgi:PST family polysaccharide transporter